MLNMAFVLHTRPYRETSLLVELLTYEEGRVSVIANGAKRLKSPLKSCLQMFAPLSVEYTGRHDLQTLKIAEPLKSAYTLQGKALFCGFYINELIIHLLHRHEAHTEIFELYEHTLHELSRQQDLEPALRSFEIQLLEFLGYAVNLTHDAQTQRPIAADKYYYWVQHLGLCETESGDSRYLGKHLLNMANQIFTDTQTCQTAKFLMREVIEHLLGNKTIKSRELFR